MGTEYDKTAATARKFDGKGTSQEDRILRILIDANGGWVPAPRLAQIALQYARAICALRKDGAVISNRVEQHGRVRHGFYRLDKASLAATTGDSVSGVDVSKKAVAGTAPMFTQPVRCWAGDDCR